MKTERYLNPSDENTKKITDRSALLRAVSLMMLIVIACYFFETIRDSSYYIIISLGVNPLIMIGGWLITGGINFTKVSIDRVTDRQRAVKITILHSILLAMAIISIALESRVLTKWEVIYGSIYHFSGNLQTMTYYILQGFIVIGMLVMMISIYEYRYFSIEYYSVICHGVGFIYTLRAYINMIQLLDKAGYTSQVVLKREWNYIEALALASAFLLYCSKIREKYHC